jgi:hypothetical protein
VKKSGGKERKTSNRSTSEKAARVAFGETNMALEFLLVVFSEDRRVLANGDPVGITNHTLLIPPNDYIIKLEGGGFAPPEQEVVITGTSIMRPKVVIFT